MSVLKQNLEELKPQQNTKFLVPDGMHSAKCIAVADLGMIENEYQKNKDGSPKIQQKVEIVWAIDKTTEEGEALVIKKRFTLSTDDRANLTAMLKDIKVEIKSLDELLGTTCSIVTQQEQKDEKARIYANVKTFMASASFTGTGILRLPKWYGVTKTENEESQYVEVLTGEGVIIATDAESDLPY
jgi:hypothetical protein